jgi:polyadenylation factor subunit 2
VVIRAHAREVLSISFAPGDLKFVTCSDDQTVKVWDLRTAQEEATLTGHNW